MNAFCLKCIDNELLTEYQRTVTRNDDSLIHFRMISDPHSVNDLVAFMQTRTKKIVIWKTETVCIAYYGYLGKRSLDLKIDDYDFVVTGPSDKEVAQVTSFLWSLKNESQKSCIDIGYYWSKDDYFDLDVFTAVQVTTLLVNNACREMRLSGMHISAEMAAILASQQQKIRLTLHMSSFADDGAAFVDTLKKRRTSFGHLTLGRLPLKLDVQRELFQIGAFNILELLYQHDVPDENKSFLFESKSEKVLFDMAFRGDERSCVKFRSILPKKFFLQVDREEYGFPSTFLWANAKLTEMGLVIKWPETLTMSTIWRLIEKVEENQTMEVLELGIINKYWLPFWTELMRVFGDHQGLCKLRLHLLHICPEEMRTGLISMLKRNQKVIDIDFVSQQVDEQWMCQLKDTLQFNRFFQGSKTLNQDGKALDSALLGAALMKRSSNDARCTAVLLSDNVDILSKLLEAAAVDSSSVALVTRTDPLCSSFSADEESEGVAEEANVNTRKRKRLPSNDLDIESITASIQQATQEVLAKQNETIQMLIQQSQSITDEIGKNKGDGCTTQTRATSIQEMTELKDEVSFLSFVTAQTGVRTQRLEQEMRELTSDIATKQKEGVGDTGNMSTCANERTSCTIS